MSESNHNAKRKRVNPDFVTEEEHELHVGSAPNVRLTPREYIRSVPGKLKEGCTAACCLGCFKSNLKVLMLLFAILAGTGKKTAPGFSNISI